MKEAETSSSFSVLLHGQDLIKPDGLVKCLGAGMLDSVRWRLNPYVTWLLHKLFIELKGRE